jgi:hypothetical protein
MPVPIVPKVPPNLSRDTFFWRGVSIVAVPELYTIVAQKKRGTTKITWNYGN